MLQACQLVCVWVASKAGMTTLTLGSAPRPLAVGASQRASHQMPARCAVHPVELSKTYIAADASSPDYWCVILNIDIRTPECEGR